MIKLKGTGMIMAIMIVAVLGWTAIVGLVIKPTIWVGILIVPLGGIAIGVGISYLIWRWWLKEIPL